MRRRGWILAAGLVVLGNLVVLAGVAWNRVGEPQGVLKLTERELPMAPRSDEDSSITLWVGWRGGTIGPAWHPRAEPEWLDESKLTELGFDCSVPFRAEAAEFHYDKQLPREGFVVLEFDGEAWSRWLAEQEREIETEAAEMQPGPEAGDAVQDLRDDLERARVGASRLFAIDSGPDAGALRARYPDLTRHVVVAAVFGLSTDRTGLVGVIRHLRIDRIHVSRTHRGMLEELESADHEIGRDGPRYSVTLHFGRRLEPWIEEIS